MKLYQGFTKAQLEKRKKEIEKQFDAFKQQNLKLDMSRGKPSSEQLDLSNGMFKYATDFLSETGIDCRNYGGLDGLPEMKKIFSQIMGVSPDEVIVGNNSSLNMMYDCFARAYNHGLLNSKPWSKQDKIKFLCPSPGYDRHFAICERFNMEMITIPMDENGPDMDRVESLVAEDDAIKGIWCVPMYSNPTGIIYSDSVVKRLAQMKTRAEDFRIFWDNAYAVHHLYEENTLLNILEECQKAGNENRVFIFASTAKISFACAGVAAMAASKENIEHIKKQLSIQFIGPNKITHLLHARFFKDFDGIKDHMKKQADLIRPKFEMTINTFEKYLGGLNIATWTKPRGGYFISFDVPEGCASQVVAKAQEAGVSLTSAGATYPYGKDPKDTNIRIAPTFPPLSELKQALEVLCICVEWVVLGKLVR